MKLVDPFVTEGMTELEARVKAAQATLDAFRERPFDPGTYDCAKMAKFHARLMGCPVKGIAKAGGYKTILGMKRALRRLDCASIGDLADRQRGWLHIAPAEAWPGDIIELEGDDGEDGIGMLAVRLTNGRCAGYHEAVETGVAVMQPEIFGRAWRLPWKPVSLAGAGA